MKITAYRHTSWHWYSSQKYDPYEEQDKIQMYTIPICILCLVLYVVKSQMWYEVIQLNTFHVESCNIELRSDRRDISNRNDIWHIRVTNGIVQRYMWHRIDTTRNIQQKATRHRACNALIRHTQTCHWIGHNARAECMACTCRMHARAECMQLRMHAAQNACNSHFIEYIYAPHAVKHWNNFNRGIIFFLL